MGNKPQDLICLRILKWGVLLIRGPHARSLLAGFVVMIVVASLAFVFWAALKYKLVDTWLQGVHSK